jgi:hypothetical protein
MMGAFMESCHPLLEQAMMDRTTDDIVKLTISEAIRYSEIHQGSIIHEALRIRSGVFLLTTELAIQGNENLDVENIDGNTPSYFNIPLPTVLEYQTDTAAILVLRDLQETVLKGLNKLVFCNDRTKVWYEVFLVTFVLLSTIELVYGKQQEYLFWHNDTVCISSTYVFGISNLT